MKLKISNIFRHSALAAAMVAVPAMAQQYFILTPLTSQAAIQSEKVDMYAKSFPVVKVGVDVAIQKQALLEIRSNRFVDWNQVEITVSEGTLPNGLVVSGAGISGIPTSATATSFVLTFKYGQHELTRRYNVTPNLSLAFNAPLALEYIAVDSPQIDLRGYVQASNPDFAAQEVEWVVSDMPGGLTLDSGVIRGQLSDPNQDTIQGLARYRGKEVSFSLNLDVRKDLISRNGIRQFATGQIPKSCNEYKNGVIQPYAGNVGSGFYLVKPAATAYEIYCEMELKGGGWTLILARNNASHLPSKLVDPTTSGYTPRSTYVELAQHASEVLLYEAATQKAMSSTAPTVIANLKSGNTLNRNATPASWVLEGIAASSLSYGWNGESTWNYGYPLIYWANDNQGGVHVSEGSSCWTWTCGMNNFINYYIR